jgi:hypothetical protein
MGQGQGQGQKELNARFRRYSKERRSESSPSQSSREGGHDDVKCHNMTAVDDFLLAFNIPRLARRDGL